MIKIKHLLTQAETELSIKDKKLDLNISGYFSSDFNQVMGHCDTRGGVSFKEPKVMRNLKKQHMLNAFLRDEGIDPKYVKLSKFWVAHWRAKFVLKVDKQLVQQVNNNAKLQKSIITSMLLLFMSSFY